MDTSAESVIEVNNHMANKEKDLATKAKDRVAIAKDALKWHRAGALDIRPGSYVRPLRGNALIRNEQGEMIDRDTEARDVVIGKCEVCALGALLIAKAVRFDAVTIGQLKMNNAVALKDYFSNDQINSIEAAFEGTSYPSINGTCNDAIYTAGRVNSDWIARYPNHAVRFRAVMRNIIKNNGTFVPGKF